jgi:uncharacterized protein with FMN-binding domain
MVEAISIANAVYAQAVASSAPKQQVTLTISCRKLKNLDVMSKSDPQVDVFMREN